MSHKEQLLISLQLSVTAARIAFCKKYVTVLNRAQIFAYRRTRTTYGFDMAFQVTQEF